VIDYHNARWKPETNFVKVLFLQNLKWWRVGSATIFSGFRFVGYN